MAKKILYFIIIAQIIITHAWAKPVTNNSHDNAKPIEITADSLEVLQETNTAIFAGDVRAKQGELDIRSKKMTVFYKNDNKEPGNNAAGKIAKVEIDGDVFISSPNETAKGNKGVYDVDKEIITLEGDVTLTSQKNIVKGHKLVYNLKTGQSKIVSDSGDSKKTRVKGVFIPNAK